jgi:phosphoribosylaminoimidazole-succinocarboxamide synthase
MREAVTQTNLTLGPVRRGKVRDIYDLGERLLMISSDRISAFDWVLPTPIPDKGRVLTQISAFWFERLQTPHHLLSLEVESLGLPAAETERLAGRSMIVRKCAVVPIECVVRGYLEGSGWKEYQQTQAVCGIPLPPGLQQGSQLAEPIFTPATKEESGHDINISFERMVDLVGAETARELRQRSIDIYRRGAEYAMSRGILIADTKFEWGRVDDGQLILIDEVLTPDSSRFWPADQYQPGRSQPSFDKQFVRDHLTATGWDKNSDPPPLPEAIVSKTREMYIAAYERLTGQDFAWK